MTPIRHPVRRLLAGTGLVLAALVAPLVVGVGPAGAAGPCNQSPAHSDVCSSFSAYLRRQPTPAELDQWALPVPYRRAELNVTVGHSLESRRQTVRAYYLVFGNRPPSASESAYWEVEVAATNGLRRLEAALLGAYTGMLDGYLDQVFLTELGRLPSHAEKDYWGHRALATSRTKAAAEVASTLEARRAKVVFAFSTERGQVPDAATRDAWAEALRTGLGYLDLRIALRVQAPWGTGWCSPAPRPGQGCL